MAELVGTVPGREPIRVQLMAGADVDRLGLLGRLVTALKAIIWGEAG